MKSPLIYPIGCGDACRFAEEFLKKAGFAVTDHPAPEVTGLLLDVPSFRTPGILPNGQPLTEILDRLPPDITVIGGNLSAVESTKTIDLLKDEEYLAENAAITAQCALSLASRSLQTVLKDAPALVIGWGRIGKCLAKYLSALGGTPIVCARRETHRGMLNALGYRAAAPEQLPPLLPRFRLIFNTVPARVLSQEDCASCKNCLKIDLASVPGLSGEDVISARGLPGKMAPESSGKLICRSVARLWKEGT